MSRRQRNPPRPAETPPPPPAPAPLQGPSIPRRQRLIWIGILAVIFCVVGTWGQFDFGQMMGYYDLFVDALAAGQLHLLMTPDQVNLVDMVPFEGKWQFNWGPFPTVFHWVPRLVGLRLSDRVAAIVAGLVACWFFLSIMAELRRRFFPEMPQAFVGWFLFAFALTTPLSLTVLRGNVYNESIGIAVACILGSFRAWLAHTEKPSLMWAVLCGLGVGFAIITRITLALYGVVFFAALLAVEWLRPKVDVSGATARLGALSLPILLCGFLQMGFNDARFNGPFDFGNRYKPEHTKGYPLMALNRIPESTLHYFFSPIDFSSDFPYMAHKGWEPVVNVRRAEACSSLLLASPWLLLIACTWPALKPGGRGSPQLKMVIRTVAGAGALSLLGMLLFGAVSRRYSQEFMPTLSLLAFLGAGLCAGVTYNWRKWTPAAWAVVALGFLLNAQIAFYQSFTTPTPDVNVVRAFVAMTPTLQRLAPGPKLNEEASIAANDLGTVLLQQRRFAEAVDMFEKAAAWQPESDRIRQNLETARRMAESR